MKAITQDGDEIEMVRGQVVFADDTEGRLYVDEETLPDPTPDEQFPSTTTVNGILKGIIADHRIETWKNKQADPDNLLRWYQARGEIAHEYTYKYLADELDSLEHEAELGVAFRKLRDDCDLDYFPLSDEPYDRYAITSGLWAARKMADVLLEDIQEVIYCEKYVVNTEVGFAGQFDLLYLSVDNNLVLTDLKTAKGLHANYRFQVSAYKHSLPLDKIKREVKEDYGVDVNTVEVQILRANTEYKSLEVETNYDWGTSSERYWGKFVKAVEQFRDEKIPVKELKF